MLLDVDVELWSWGKRGDDDVRGESDVVNANQLKMWYRHSSTIYAVCAQALGANFNRRDMPIRWYGRIKPRKG